MHQDTSDTTPSEAEGQELLPSTGELLLATLHPRDCLSPPKCAYLADGCEKELASRGASAASTLMSTGRALKLVRARIECALPPSSIPEGAMVPLMPKTPLTS